MDIETPTIACQHCYRKVQLLPSEDPAAMPVLVDHRGERECIPGMSPVFHKLMPRVV